MTEGNSEHTGGHDEHGHGAEHGAGHGHGGHGHVHDDFGQYLHDPPKQPTPEQRAALKRVAAENAKKLRGKNRVEAIRAIAELQKNHDLQHELGPLLLQLRIEIMKILEK